MSEAESVGDVPSFKEENKINWTLQWLRPLIAAPRRRAKVVAKASPLQFCSPLSETSEESDWLSCAEKKKKLFVLGFVKTDAGDVASTREKPAKQKQHPGDALRVPPDAW